MRDIWTQVVDKNCPSIIHKNARMSRIKCLWKKTQEASRENKKVKHPIRPSIHAKLTQFHETRASISLGA